MPTIKPPSLLFLFLIAFINTSKACSCTEIVGFSLYQFDQADMVVELSIIAKIPDTTAKKMPPPLYFIENYQVEVKMLFKGNPQNQNLLQTKQGNYCGWSPVLGESYILYLNLNDEGIMVVENICQRRLSTTDSRFESEKAILLFLSKKESKKQVLPQTFSTSTKDFSYLPFKGHFKNGARHGRWQLTEFVFKNTFQSNQKANRTVLVLHYKQGELIHIHPRFKEIRYADEFKKKEFIAYYLFYEAVWDYYKTQIDSIH